MQYLEHCEYFVKISNNVFLPRTHVSMQMLYLMRKIEPLIDIQDLGTLMAKLVGLRKDKDDLTRKYNALAQIKLQQETSH